jgi:hypothetical protein
MARKRARADANQPAFVLAVRAAGGEVLHLHELGEGAPDLLTILNNRLALVELKRNRKANLTDDEAEFARKWPGKVYKLCCIEEWLRLYDVLEGSATWWYAVEVYRAELQELDRKTGDTLYKEYLDSIERAS